MLVLTVMLIAQIWLCAPRCSRDSHAHVRRDIKETEKRAKSSVQVMSVGITMSARHQLQSLILGAKKFPIIKNPSFYKTLLKTNLKQ